jgi:hypothetical protein
MTMTNPMSNVVFDIDMAAATLSNGSPRGVVSNAPAPRSQVIGISLKPSTKQQAGGCVYYNLQQIADSSGTNPACTAMK